MGSKIRQFLRELFGSRVSALLEEEVMRVRSDYESRLNDKDVVIADLRERVAALSSKLETWELVLIPLKSPVGNLLSPRPKPVFEPPIESGWASIRADWERRQQEEIEQEKKNEGIPVKVQEESVGA
jgi:hypothetical protein